MKRNLEAENARLRETIRKLRQELKEKDRALETAVGEFRFERRHQYDMARRASWGRPTR